MAGSDKSFPLIGFFAICAAIASALACIDFRALANAHDETDVFFGRVWNLTLVIVAASAIIGVVLGAVLGASHPHAVMGAFAWGALGAVCGLIVGAALAAPVPFPATLGPAAVFLITLSLLRLRAP